MKADEQRRLLVSQRADERGRRTHSRKELQPVRALREHESKKRRVLLGEYLDRLTDQRALVPSGGLEEPALALEVSGGEFDEHVAVEVHRSARSSSQ